MIGTRLKQLISQKVSCTCSFHLLPSQVVNASWLPEVLDTTYSCPPCHLSCIFGRQTALTPDPDALLYEGHLPNISRAARGQPLRVYLNMEVEGGRRFGLQEGVDVWVGYSSNASVQATYAAHLLHWDRQRFLSTSKRKVGLPVCGCYFVGQGERGG